MSPVPNATHRSFGPVYATAVIVSLALWLACLLMAGVSAAIVFPTVHRLDPRLSGYEQFTGEHWKLAAGQVQQRIFLVCDVGQLAFGGVAFLTLGLMLIGAGTPRLERRTATGVLVLSVCVALMLLCYHLIVLSPRMQRNLREYWDEAAAGQNQRSAIAQAAFDVDHPTASRVLSITFGCVGVGLVSACWLIASGRTGLAEGRA